MNMQQAITISQAPDYAEIIDGALSGVVNKSTYRNYARWLRKFLGFYDNQGRPQITRGVIKSFLGEVQSSSSRQNANQALSAIKKLVEPLLDYGIIDEATAARLETMKGKKILGRKLGKRLSETQAIDLVNAPDPNTLRGLRDRAILAIAVGCGLRRFEIAKLQVGDIHWDESDKEWLIEVAQGKHNRSRHFAISQDVRDFIDRWLEAANIKEGWLFPTMDRAEKIEEKHITPDLIYYILKRHCKRLGLDVSPHDLRRTAGKIAYDNGADLKQIQLMYGHASIQTTERYLAIGVDYKNSPSKFIPLKRAS